MNRRLVALLPFASLALLGNAQAATDTTTFNVTITITESCTFSAAATDVDFGSQVRSTSTSNIPAQGELVVNCSDGTPYTIGLSDGGNASGGNRRMTDGSNFVGYGLFRDNAHTNPWGEAVDLLSGNGDGTDQNIPIYGLVTNLNAPAGSYSDTVTATVTY